MRDTFHNAGRRFVRVCTLTVVVKAWVLVEISSHVHAPLWISTSYHSDLFSQGLADIHHKGDTFFQHQPDKNRSQLIVSLYNLNMNKKQTL